VRRRDLCDSPDIILHSRTILDIFLIGTYATPTPFGWQRGVVVSGVRRMSEVNARRALLLPGLVTVFGRVYHLGM